MKKHFLSFAVSLFILTPIHALQDQAIKTKMPNVIIVITDDQGKNDLGCEGNPWIQTPALDQFYEKSVRLTNYHVSTTCTPTRGALMTGRHTNRVNTFHTLAGRSLIFEDEHLLPQVLAENGYTTSMFGKWHLGDNYPFRPMDRGFHEVVRHGGGGIGQGPDFWGNDYFDDTYWHNGTLQEYEGYCTDVFFNEALNFIEKNKDKPFFCYISTNAPHGPLNCPEEYMDIYKELDIDERLKRFYGMITNIDDNFKRLEAKLEKLQLTDNTILIFMTDNGTAVGNKAYNAGMKGKKGSQYEGGHRVPFYLRWPKGNLEGGRDINRLTAHFDLLPTFVDLLNLKYTSNKTLDGKSIVPLLYGDDSGWDNRILYVDTQRKLDLVKYRNYSVMDDNWRFVNGKELHKIDTDLIQENNVIQEYPEVAGRLAVGYEQWWQSFINEGVDTKYAYIKVGTTYENPTHITSFDLHTMSRETWGQNHACQPKPASGMWKIDFVEGGEYKICLRRFPRHSKLKINAVFPETPKERRKSGGLPASTKSDFTKASLNVAGVSASKEINAETKEVEFIVNIPKGKYDLEAKLIDKLGLVYPSYQVYIEKL